MNFMLIVEIFITITLQLCKDIIKDKKIIMEELTVILNQRNGYCLTKNIQKLRKHNPRHHGIDFDVYIKKALLDVAKNKPRSFCIMKNTSEENLQFLLKEAINNFNLITQVDVNQHVKSYHGLNLMINICVYKYNLLQEKDPEPFEINILNSIALRNRLHKYSDDSLKRRFPSLIRRNGELMFKTVYTIQISCNIRFVHLNTKQYCNIALICCDDSNRINLMYESCDNNILFTPVGIINIEMLKHVYNGDMESYSRDIKILTKLKYGLIEDN